MVRTCTAVFLVLISIGAASCRLDEKLDSMLKSDVFKLLNSREPRIHILVMGKVGVGKSTLINALVGENVTETGDCVSSVTKKITKITVFKEDVQVHITDTPGLGEPDTEDDDDVLYELQKQTKDVDVFLYCLKMTERLERYHIQEIKDITRIIGKDIWKKALFVLTFANNVNESKFTSKLHEWDNAIKKKLPNIVGKEIAEKLPIVPTGFKKPQLPDRPSWVSEFWIQGFRRMNFIAMLRLMQLNKKRLHESLDEEFAEENPEDQPLIICNMSRIYDPNLLGIGQAIGGILFAAISFAVPGMSVFAPIASYAGIMAGNWTAAIVQDIFDLGEKEIHCYDAVIWPSLYAAFLEEYPKYQELAFLE